jgi:putative sterol carrier protein
MDCLNGNICFTIKERRETMAAPTISEFMSSMATAFVPEKAAGIDATIQLKLTGTQSGEWFITIKDNQCTFRPGAASAAKLIVTADSDNFMKIFTGQMVGMQAFMQGKIKIAGDMNLALKLMGLFKI